MDILVKLYNGALLLIKYLSMISIHFEFYGKHPDLKKTTNRLAILRHIMLFDLCISSFKQSGNIFSTLIIYKVYVFKINAGS